MNAIVITSIYPPTKAIRAYAALPGWQMIVVGDRKTPRNWSYPGVTFLPAEGHERLGFRLTDRLPYNHYGRKMLGYLQAIQAGAVMIVDTDDDNIPNPLWGFPSFDGRYDATEEGAGFINVYRYYTDQLIWPRGYPLRQIRSGSADRSQFTPKDVRIGIWQGLADGDPDVDAIYRLTLNTPCTFRMEPPMALEKGTVCPFNSQNTAYRRELYPLLYLPANVTFRFTDILRGLVAQPIMWQLGYRLGFTAATVVQERNPHDYMMDFVDEIPCYLHPERILESVTGALRSGSSMESMLYDSYEALHREGIVPSCELALLELWLQDLQLAAKRRG